MKPISRIETIYTLTCPVCGWKTIHDSESDEMKNCPECDNDFTKKKDSSYSLKTLATTIPNAVYRISQKGVPHVVVDSFYSVAYFRSTKTYTIFSGYALPENKTVLRECSYKEVTEFFNSKRV